MVWGLQAGADDDLTKPFGIQAFLARVQALTRRQQLTASPMALNYGDLEVDLVQRRVHLKGRLYRSDAPRVQSLYMV